MPLDIGEVVRRSGVPASTLRYYEERGLLAPIGRVGLRRQFDARVLDTLSLIALGRVAGFSLDEIRAMLMPGGRASIDRRQLLARADQIDRMLRQLTALRDSLRHTAECPASEHMACPTFLRLVRLAGARQAGRPGRKP
ncbi:helix-turn-helix domain-containing protein [Burkholderia gladioli]|uniref:helix-turn-helix domain-containing protein n=1 Tax=Burkholderia gladioli TaxID=28095 RepID=UPI003F79D6EA